MELIKFPKCYTLSEDNQFERQEWMLRFKNLYEFYTVVNFYVHPEGEKIWV